MSKNGFVVLDGNEAAASVAHRLSEVIAIYPITPASPMGEFADEWSAHGKTNIWGTVPRVIEMQSEAGAAGAVHGALQGGALTTTFTASQGLLLMLPNMYKIAGELTAFTMHVASRTVATHALSIFADHSDVMACRQTGFALLASASVQESHDMACVAHAASLESRVPFVHFFDGFRTSHEIAKVRRLTDEDLRGMVDESRVEEHRARALCPDHPVIRGTAQNPDTFFQARERINPFYGVCPQTVQSVMDRFAARTGRSYHLFDFVGDPEAERVIVIMGSGSEPARETVEWLAARGEGVGLVTVRLFRPFSAQAFFRALPGSARKLAVLDRTKEPGSVGEPLYQDVVTAVNEGAPWEPDMSKPAVHVTGGRYGLSSKEFTPAMVKGVFDELHKEGPKRHFTVGIRDDVTHLSVDYDPEFDIERDEVVRGVFFGLGADGTVGASKNSVKIIGEETDADAQGYFVYDSKKAGGMTVSHLRFGPGPIRSSYLIRKASFVACHHFPFLDRYHVLEHAAPGAVFLLNAPYGPEEVWDHLCREVQEEIIGKRLKFYVIDAGEVARRAKLGVRINTIMQTCFFALSGVLPRDEASDRIKRAIQETYGKKGDELVRRNFRAVDEALAGLHEVRVPETPTAGRTRPPAVPEEAPEAVRQLHAEMIAGSGDRLPVSAMPVDGTWITGTTRWEKRSIAHEIPVWEPDVCMQCGKCAFVCPHATIRMSLYDADRLEGAPEGFRSADARGRVYAGKKLTVQVAPEDCIGCGLCVMTCPAKDKSRPERKAVNMQQKTAALDRERANWAFFSSLPEFDPASPPAANVKDSQLRRPLFEFPGACAGCGETQYIRLLTQLFGDRALIANATGCSSIYGGNLPTTPYCTNQAGRGPAWSNSLFEDNGEFGFGMRLGADAQRLRARHLLQGLAAAVGPDLAREILDYDPSTEDGVAEQRARVEALRKELSRLNTPEARALESVADWLVAKSVWIVGGDGWAYDIGYGGLDHVLSLGSNVNVLVLDTQVYSNTGGQQSKATPLGAAAKFAAGGKEIRKKDLGQMAMTYEGVYVAQVAFGADDRHTLRAFLEAESYPGPSLIIAYAHCIAHGYDLAYGCTHQKLAVDSGAWLLYRFDPRRVERGENPLQVDSGPPSVPLEEYFDKETRFRMLRKVDPDRARQLLESARRQVLENRILYTELQELGKADPLPEEDQAGGTQDEPQHQAHGI